MEQYYAAVQLNYAQLVQQQLVQHQQVIHHQGMFVQQQQYSYVPEFHQQFTHPSYYMPPPPRQQQVAWDGGGAPPPGERPPPRDKLRTEECRHFARGHCQRGVSCNFAHTTPKEKQGTQDSQDAPSNPWNLPRRPLHVPSNPWNLPRRPLHTTEDTTDPHPTPPHTRVRSRRSGHLHPEGP